VLIVRQDNVMN